MQNNNLIAGLLGSGAYAAVHAKVYTQHPNVELKWIWSPTEKNRRQFADEYNTTMTDSWQEIINDPEVDFIAVATPDFAHTEYVLKALETDKHVLVEKPMAMSVNECERIVEAKNKSGKKLMVNYHNRWYPALAQAKEVIKSGKIGKPVSGNLILSDSINWTLNNMKWGDKSGPEWFLMSHIADLTLWLLDDIPDSVQAFAREGLLTANGINCQDLVKANIQMKDGAVVHLETSWILARGWRNPVNEFTVSIQGEIGRVDINGDHENLTVVSENYVTPFTILDSTEIPPIQDFINCILNNQPVPVTAEEGLLATALVEAVVESYKNNSVVNFSNIYNKDL